MQSDSHELWILGRNLEENPKVQNINVQLLSQATSKCNKKSNREIDKRDKTITEKCWNNLRETSR